MSPEYARLLKAAAGLERINGVGRPWKRWDPRRILPVSDPARVYLRSYVAWLESLKSAPSRNDVSQIAAATCEQIATGRTRARSAYNRGANLSDEGVP